MTEKMTKREQFYYDKGYVDGRKAFMEEVTKATYEIDDCLYNDDYANGYNSAIAKVVDVLNEAVVQMEENSYAWLEKGMRFYMPDTFAEELYEWFTYDADKWDKRAMERGIVFQTKEEAIECAKEMLAAVSRRTK